MSASAITPETLEVNGDNGIPKCFNDVLDNAKEVDFLFLNDGKVPSKLTYRVSTVLTLRTALKDIGFYSKDDTLYIYNGTHWVALDKKPIKSFLTKLTAKYKVPLMTSEDYIFGEELYKQLLFSCEGNIYKKVGLDVAQLNLSNGTLKVENGVRKMHPFNKEDLFHYTLGFNYDADAKSPLFDKFLSQSIPDKELQKVVAEYLGTIFIPNQANTFQSEKFLAFKGEGSNGKGVFTKILTALFGRENVVSFGLDALCDTQGNSRSGIEHKLLNIASETGLKLNDNNLKILASGEEIMIKRMYKDVSLMTDYAKIIVSINKSFYGGDKTHAYYRRFMIIPFDNIVKEEDKDKMLASKIIESELSGVLNWVLDGLDRYIKSEGQFTSSGIIDGALNSFQKEDNNALRFIDDLSYYITNDFQDVQPIYNDFKEWCINEGIKGVESKQTFTKTLIGKMLDNKIIKGIDRMKSSRRRGINITRSNF